MLYLALNMEVKTAEEDLANRTKRWVKGELKKVNMTYQT
jgi:hypothetical protein